MKLRQILDRPSSKKIIERVSFWGGVIGAILLAVNLPFSGWGYIPFMLSNVATLHLLQKSNASKAITYQIYFFVVINTMGIVCWLLL